MIGMRLACGLPLFAVPLLAVALLAAPRLASAQGIRPVQPATENAPDPNAARDKTAQLIGILPEVAELRKLPNGSATADRWQLLWLHQRISEQVLAASLQVDAAIAQIDNEISRANELRGYLSDRRDRTVNRANLLGIIVGGGLGAAGSGLQFSSSLEKAGDALSLSGGVFSVGSGLIGLHAQAGKTSRFDFESNMLAEFFDRPVLDDSHYPETVWTFLNQPSPFAPEITRKQQLIQTWVQVKRIDSLASKEKIERLTSQPAEQRQLSIDDFEDRAAMLQDVRARISFLKRDLGELLRSLPTEPASLTDSTPKSAP